MELIHVIQKVVRDVITSMNLTDVCYGDVVQINPIEVQLSNRLIIGGELLRLTTNVIEQKHTHNITGNNSITETVTVPALAVGDKLLMLKALRGSLYVVLDRVV